MHGDEQEIFADAGYHGPGKREKNQAHPRRWSTAMKRSQRKRLSDSPDDQMTVNWERVKAKVERHFHVVKTRFGYRKARYRGLAKTEAQLYTLFGLANQLLARRRMCALPGRGVSRMRETGAKRRLGRQNAAGKPVIEARVGALSNFLADYPCFA